MKMFVGPAASAMGRKVRTTASGVIVSTTIITCCNSKRLSECKSGQSRPVVYKRATTKK